MKTAATNGFIYYAVGDPAIQEAVQSVTSLKNHMPDAQITVFTSEANRFLYDGVTTIAVPAIYSKSARVHALRDSPYEATFYIDSDTVFVTDCSEIFDLLRENDFLLSLSNLRFTNPPDLPASFPFYNSGIIGYRRTQAVHSAFSAWEKYLGDKLKDDPSVLDEPGLQKVIHQHQLIVGILPAQYNYRPRTAGDNHPASVAIVHCHGDLGDIAKAMSTDTATIISLLPQDNSGFETQVI